MWLDHLPASVAFCDVETTGLGNHDRIVSFGGIGMISRDLAKGRPNLEYLYLVFDPGTANRGDAEQIHGFSDSTLRLQDPFAVHAADVWRFLTSYELLVAHNAAFDLRFINRDRAARAHQARLLHRERIPRARPRRQRFSERGPPPHQARSCWRSARRDRGCLARDADLPFYLWLHGCPLQGRLRGSLPRTPSNSRHAEIGPYRVDRSPDRRRVTNLQISESTIFFCLEGLLCSIPAVLGCSAIDTGACLRRLCAQFPDRSSQSEAVRSGMKSDSKQNVPSA